MCRQAYDAERYEELRRLPDHVVARIESFRFQIARQGRVAYCAKWGRSSDWLEEL